MSTEWYCSHAGSTHGPFSTAELKERAARMQLLETDLIWPKDGDASGAVRAGSVIGFAHAAPPTGMVTQPPATPSAVPDWLSDVATTPSSPLKPAPVANPESPEWLEDLRLWVGLELSAPANAVPAPSSSQTGAIPDWLAGWSMPETPRPAPAPKPPTPAPLVAAPVKSPAPAPIVAMPVQPPAPAAAPPAVDPRVQEMRQTNGFDPETGQILDAEKFQRWKQGKAQSTTVSNATMLEVFRKARFAIESWVDDDANRAPVMYGELHEIKRHPKIRAILQEYAAYGQAMQDRLLQHLEFMVNNHRKYHQMVQRTGGAG